MAYVNFVIPLNKSELLKETDDHYYVRNIVGPKSIYTKINEAKQSLKEDGVGFITDHFDVYYSVIHHSDVIPMNIITKAYLDLHKAVQDLDKTLSFILNDKESLVDNSELKMKFLNIMNMLFYIYTNIVILIENKTRTNNLQTKNRNKKSNNINEAMAEFNKKSILIALNNVLQKEIVLFWDPPVAEEMFINMVAEVCYTFLENESIKLEKEVRVELFSMIGTLLKTYNHGTTFLVRMVQLIKAHEHFIQCVPEGIQFLIDNYNAKSLVHNFVKEITEWQIDESVQDNQGTRFCASVLSNMAVLMPTLMLPEVMYLNQYLKYESYPLRNSVLSVITEVIIKVLNKPGLNEEEVEFRNEFLDVLEEHLYDVSAHVRSKAYLHWIRLQTEMAVPMEKQNNILKKATKALNDKSALVRKNAANCITVFLSHNFYGHKLNISFMKTQLELKQNELYKLKGNDEEEAKQFLVEHKDDIQKAIEEALKEQFEVDIEVPNENVSNVILQYIKDKRFKEAIYLIHKEGDNIANWQQLEEDADDEERVEFYIFMIGRIFMSAAKVPQPNLNEEELKALKEIEDSVTFYKNAVEFLETINEAIKPMSDLLESATVGDMQEAVEFFIAAHKFDIDNSIEGILEMLKIMQRNETERKDIVTEALRKIYLQTDEEQKEAHSVIVVSRLINLVKMVSFRNLDDVKLVISEWARKNILDNTIIRTLWKYFAKDLDVSDDDSRAALFLLYMASCGRKSIIEHNIKYVANISFGEQGLNDLLLVSIACQLLAVFGREKQDITAANPPQRIKHTDEMWKQLTNIFIENFDKPVPYYKKAFSCSAEFIYQVCSKPDLIFEEFTKQIISKMSTTTSSTDVHEIDSFVLARCCHILGEIAIRQLNFLDNDIFKELKRRNYNRDNKKCQENLRKNNPDRSSIMSASKSAIDTNTSTILSQQGEDGTLEGAQAEDGDAEFILNVLENDTVTGSSMLGKLAYIVKTVCQYPNLYDESALQGSAVIALLRYMLVSSRFCAENVQLIFTILEKTKYPHIKCSILIHCSDLLERFPNVIEPWTPRLALRLKDSDYDVRKSTFYMLANLSLKDMIRVNSYISDMALVIVDPDEKLSEMSKNFFIMFTRKGNNLCNVLPDIFSHICTNEDITEDKLQYIMKFLFELIDKAKLMESLVDRFCIKLQMTENEYTCTNIAYCLTLITYNDKGAKRLLSQFDAYKHSLHFNGVYSSFKTILNSLNKQQKNEVKAIAVELEDKIKTFFEINQNENPQNPLPVFKKPKGRARKKKQKKNNDTEDEINEDDLSCMDE